MTLEGWKGLSPYQRWQFDAVYCVRRHRFDGANFPTPEGLCPRCEWREADRQIQRFQGLLVTASPGYSPVGLTIQEPPAVLLEGTDEQT